MRTTLMTLTLAVLCPITQAQPADNPFGGTGSITSQNEFKREIRNANDTGVEGTEFFKLTYQCTWELVRSRGMIDRAKPVCTLECQGKKHVKHTDCDTSCDKPCPIVTHRFSFSGKIKYFDKEMRKAERDADNMVYQSGADPHAANWTSYLTRSLRNAQRLAEQVRQYAVPCWNDVPCTESHRYYGIRPYEFRVTGTLTENGYYVSRGVKTPYGPRNRGTHTAVVAEVWLPDDDPFATFPVPRCKCKPVPIKNGGGGAGEIRDGWVPPIPGGVIIWDDEDGNAQDCVKLTVSGIDLNRVHIEARNDCDHAVTVGIGGGLVITPSDGKDQSMTVLVPVTLAVAAHSTASVDARAACTAMNKSEPTTATKFTIANDLNPTLQDLGAFTTASRFRGPADQARVWIATDHATFDEIKKHLLPGPSQGQYLNALYDVSRATGVDINSPEFKKCFEPGLLVTTTAKPEAVEWFVQHLDRTSPGSLSELGKRHGLLIGELLGEKADDGDVAAVSNLITALCSCSSIEGRMAGLTLLLKAVPTSRREKFVEKGGLDMLVTSTTSEDPKEQEQALEVIDVYSHKPYVDEVNKLAALGASEAVKKKAAAVAARLGA